VTDIDARNALRFALEEGRSAQRELQHLKSALSKLPGFDIAQLHGGAKTPRSTHAPPSTTIASPGRSPELSREDLDLIRVLISRLTDRDEMRRCGLVLESDRLKVIGTGSSIIKSAEMAILRRLIG